MFEPKHLLDLQDSHQTAAGGGSDASSWLSGHHTASSPASLHRALSSLSNAASAGNPDPVLFNNLVEMVPLVQSLIVSIFLFFYDFFNDYVSLHAVTH